MSTRPGKDWHGLRMGPESEIQYTDALALPVDGSDPLLRMLSPFSIRVEPPRIYEADQNLFDGNAKRGLVDVYGRAGRNTFKAARGAISQAGFVGLDYQGRPTATTRNTQSRGRAGQKTDNVEKGSVPTMGKPAIADLNTALDQAVQLGAVIKTPPLVLLINPATMQRNFTRIQAFQDRTRHGYVFQAWGEEQPKISFTAKCGAFISGGRGVQMLSRLDSAAWQNLMSVFHLYRNNGYIYDTDGKSNAHLAIGALSLHYDGWIYYGHMDSFSFAHEEANQQGGVEFNIEFTASLMVDTSRASLTVQPIRPPPGIAAARQALGQSIGADEVPSQQAPQGSPAVVPEGRGGATGTVSLPKGDKASQKPASKVRGPITMTTKPEPFTGLV